MGAESLWHWIVVIGIVLLLFGRGRVSELMSDTARGIKAFKKAMATEDAPTAAGEKSTAFQGAEPDATNDPGPASHEPDSSVNHHRTI